MSDDLEQLGAIGFQDLAAGLAVAAFGPGVQVMGAGRDGGRDLFHRGVLIWKPTHAEPGEVWDGYTVMQAKHMAAPSSKHQENAAWLWTQVRAELEAWSNPAGDRKAIPDYLIIITNVKLTPFPEAGGFDTLDTQVSAYLERLKMTLVIPARRPPPTARRGWRDCRRSRRCGCGTAIRFTPSSRSTMEFAARSRAS